MALEGERVFSAVWARLRGDATLTAMLASGVNGIHRDVAPITPTGPPGTPYVVITRVAGADVNTLSGGRVYTNNLIQVTVWGRGVQDRMPIRLAADRIDTLLQEYGVVVDGVVVVKLVREREIPLPPDDVGGVLFPRLDVEYSTGAYAA